MKEEFFRIANLPPYPLGEIATAVRDARLAGREVIDLSQINPSLEPPAVALDKLVQNCLRPHNHRYSASQGINRLRKAFCNWYGRRFDVELDSEREIVVTMGSKEGIAHLLQSVVSPGETVLVPTPSYPIHTAAVFLAGAAYVGVPLYRNFSEAEQTDYRLDSNRDDFFMRMERIYERTWPRPRLLVISFPHNPTTTTVTYDFFERLLKFCKERQVYLVHDFAYADLCFEKEAALSVLSIPGAREVAVESYSLSKGFGLAGWRIACMAGNAQLIDALKRIKGYLDFGTFQPLQIAAAHLLESEAETVSGHLQDVVATYRARRDVLTDGLRSQGWRLPETRATVFLWAGIPDKFAESGSLSLGHRLLDEANIAACPGIGFDADADGHMRFALVEPENRLRQALEQMNGMGD